MILQTNLKSELTNMYAKKGSVTTLTTKVNNMETTLLSNDAEFTTKFKTMIKDQARLDDKDANLASKISIMETNLVRNFS